MYSIVLSYTDEQLIQHLEEQHPGDLTFMFTEGHRKLASRRTWNVYHDYWLHKAKPETPKHEHESYLWTGWERETVKSLPGWTQKTRCTCLQPPSHQADCPGKNGVIVAGDTHGPSALDRLWIRLDSHMDGLMSKTKAELKYAAVPQAEAATIAWAIACMMNPAEPDTDSIRKEAVRRWRDRKNAS